MATYAHLSLEEREKFYAWRGQGISLREIARRLGRSHTTLSREKKRNAKYGRAYLPIRAQRQADKRAQDQRYKAPLKEPLIFLYVREHLREPYKWSPETIAGRLRIEYPGYSIDDETIYRYVYGKKTRRMKLWRFLILRRKKRMKKEGRTVKRYGKIPGAVSIELRPKEVETRTIPGHWETDNIEGKKTDRSVLSTTVERMTRLTHLTKLSDRTAGEKTRAIVSRLSNYPEEIRKTMTADNGKENSQHKIISKALLLAMFYCHSYHSWEKGSVENTNGRIRRDIPKGVSIDDISNEIIAAIEYKLNSTPRKCLGFLTPYEKMQEALSSKEKSVLTG